MEMEEYTEEVATLVLNRENYQRRLGKIASEVSLAYGKQGLDSLAEDLKEKHGLSISTSTLRNYRWVHERTFALDLPEDLAYRTLQKIASSPDPALWGNRIKDEGLSSAETYRLIMLENGIDIKEKKCPSCGYDLNKKDGKK